MKRNKITAAVLVCVLMLALVGCGKPASTAAPAQSAAASAVQRDSSSAPAAQDATVPQDTTDGANAMQKITPPYQEKLAAAELPAFLPKDLQQLYNAASFLARGLMLATGFQVDYEAEPLTMEDGMQYYPDSGFPSYSAFRAALEGAFTVEYTDKLLNESRAYVDDGNDKLYCLGAGRGSNMFYKGSDFVLSSVTDTEIVLTMTGHYAKDMDEDGNFSETETTEDYTLRLVKTDAGWRFSEFSLPF